MARLLVDTDVIVDIFMGNPGARELEQTLEGCQVAIAAQTLAELHEWMLHRGWEEPRQQRLLSYLKAFTVIYPDARICRHWAEIRYLSHPLGWCVDFASAWVAATALALGCPVVTRHTKDYKFAFGVRVVEVSRYNSETR